MLQAWVGWGNYNSYLDLRWSPLTHIAVTVLGFGVLLFWRTLGALALFLCAGLFL